MAETASTQEFASAPRVAPQVARVCAWSVAAIAAVALAGWAFDVPRLTRVVSDGALMVPNTVISFLLCAAALLLAVSDAAGGGRRKIAVGLGLSAALVGSATLFEYATGISLGIDGALFGDPLAGNGASYPGRMSPITASAFVITGVGVSLLTSRSLVAARWSFGAGIASAAIGYIVTVAYVLGVPELTALGRSVVSVAFLTAVGFLVLGLGIQTGCAAPEIRALVESEGSDGLLVRRMLPTIALTLPIVAWLRLRGEAAGLYSTQAGLVTLVITWVVVLAAIVLWSARALRVLEHEHVKATVEKEAVKRANDMKTDFLSRMSHELRTPLNTIMGYAQLLEMDPLEPAQKTAVEQILSGAKHQLALIDEILDIGKIEAGRIELSPEPLSACEVIRDCVAMVLPTARERGIELEIDPAHPEPLVKADRQRLRQVLLNLLSNAIKYNREHGQVYIRCLTQADGSVRITVTDQGPGIPDEWRDQVFVPFFRLSSGDEVPGTGLGLALSKRIVEVMRGEMGFEGGEGGGTMFWVELPGTGTTAPAASPESASDPDVPMAHDEATTVLYIEDNSAAVALVSDILVMRPGLKMATAARGDVGLQMAYRDLPSLILLDLHLADRHGGGVLQQLKAHPATRDIPVIVISADATEAVKRRSLDMGASAFVTKPFEVRQLLAAVDAALRG